MSSPSPKREPDDGFPYRNGYQDNERSTDSPAARSQEDWERRHSSANGSSHRSGRNSPHDRDSGNAEMLHQHELLFRNRQRAQEDTDRSSPWDSRRRMDVESPFPRMPEARHCVQEQDTEKSTFGAMDLRMTRNSQSTPPPNPTGRGPLMTFSWTADPSSGLSEFSAAGGLRPSVGLIGPLTNYPRDHAIPGSYPLPFGVSLNQRMRRKTSESKEKKPETVTETPTTSKTKEDEKKPTPVPDERKDDAYWERRRKNNEAAKRSRDARRQKEEEIAIRCAFLEQEYVRLQAQISVLKAENARLHCMLYETHMKR